MSSAADLDELIARHSPRHEPRGFPGRMTGAPVLLLDELLARLMETGQRVPVAAVYRMVDDEHPGFAGEIAAPIRAFQRWVARRRPGYVAWLKDPQA